MGLHSTNVVVLEQALQTRKIDMNILLDFVPIDIFLEMHALPETVDYYLGSGLVS